MSIVRFPIFSLFVLGIISCVHPHERVGASAPTPNVVLAIKDHVTGLSKPLLDDWTKGTKLFGDSQPESDAESVFGNGEILFLMIRSYSTLPVGFDDLKLLNRIMDNPKYKKMTIPGTSDVVMNTEYQRAADIYAARFNRRMATLSGLASEDSLR